VNQITLQTMKPDVIKKLQNLARSHQRTLEEEITVILENAVLIDRGVDLIVEERQESKMSVFGRGCKNLG
jgi:plasmid stability protein